MIEIPLTGAKALGRVALIDDADLELVSQLNNWQLYDLAGVLES